MLHREYLTVILISVFTSLVILSHASATEAATEPNLLFNHSFERVGTGGETDAADWDQLREDGDTYLVRRDQPSDTYVKDGEWVLRQEEIPARGEVADSYSRYFISDTFGVVGGETYTVGGWNYLVNNENNMDTEDFSYKFAIEWLDSGGDSIAIFTKPDQRSDTWGKWLETSFDTRAPDTARFARFEVSSIYDTDQLDAGDSTTDIFWDSMYVRGPGPAPERIEFVTQPGMTVKDETINPVKLEVLDTGGIRVRWTDTDVEVDIGNVSANLTGTTRKETKRGIVLFDDLSIDEVGQYRLRARAPGLQEGISNQFKIINTIKNFKIGPNPFRVEEDDRVVIQFDEFETDVNFKFEIYTITGKKMDESTYNSLDNNTNGYSQVYWRGADDLASGHYLYRLKDKISGAEITGQLVIIR